MDCSEIKASLGYIAGLYPKLINIKLVLKQTSFLLKPIFHEKKGLYLKPYKLPNIFLEFLPLELYQMRGKHLYMAFPILSIYSF